MTGDTGDVNPTTAMSISRAERGAGPFEPNEKISPLGAGDAAVAWLRSEGCSG